MPMHSPALSEVSLGGNRTFAALWIEVCCADKPAVRRRWQGVLFAVSNSVPHYPVSWTRKFKVVWQAPFSAISFRRHVVLLPNMATQNAQLLTTFKTGDIAVVILLDRFF